ncbi:hypothetical protein KAI12_03040, partial [Candidatus Bathyarchaeota archaeon]|nr:hypothetical protein [Candidatus Bathyarchaeota archaeon]
MKTFSRLVSILAVIVLAVLILQATPSRITEISLDAGADGFLEEKPRTSSVFPVEPNQVSLWAQPPSPCYGPHINANISSTEVLLNETVTITGRICPAEPNVTVRVAFTRPDYTWIDKFVVADDETGEFAVTQRLDMAGYWNIFPIHGHICDRLYANVTDPSDPQAPPPIVELPPIKLNYAIILATGVSV